MMHRLGWCIGMQPMDAYVYYLTAKTVDGQMFSQKGDVTLIR